MRPMCPSESLRTCLTYGILLESINLSIPCDWRFEMSGRC